MVLANTVLLLYEFSIRDYRMILVNFNLKNVVGYQVKIYHLEIRRLREDNKLVAEKYNEKALELLIFYNIDKKLDELEDN